MHRCSRINFKESPAVGVGNASEPRLMSQYGGMREVMCAQIRGGEVQVFTCLRSSSNHVTEVGGP